jgi:hypothetical protein
MWMASVIFWHSPRTMSTVIVAEVKPPVREYFVRKNTKTEQNERTEFTARVTNTDFEFDKDLVDIALMIA